MTTKSTTHRVLASLEKPLYEQVAEAARREHISLSQKVRDLVRQAMEHDEDADLYALVEERRKNKAPSISNEEVKRRLKIH